MLKPYDGYKETNIPWLEEVPSHWEIKKINELFKERKSKVSDKDFAPLSVTKKGIVPQLSNAAKSNDSDNRKLVCEGDFVINSRSDRKGSSGISLLTGSVSLINIALEPRKQNNSKFMHHLLKSNSFIEEYYRNGRGIVADLWTTRYSEMKTITLPVPPREEQDQIVKYLDWQTSKINTLIKAKKKQIELLKEQKQAVINKAVTKGLDDTVTMKDSGIEWLGKVPEHWDTCKLKQVVDLINDKTSENTLKYIGMENIKSWTGEYIQTEIVQPEGVSNKYYDNCILFGKLRPYLAKVLITRDSGICSGELLVLKPVSINIVLLKYILLSPIVIDIINSSTYGAKMPRANWGFIGNVEVPFPPFEEQQAIAAYLEEKTALVDKAIAVIEKEIKLVSEYKTSLISSVVTGKLDVRDVAVPDFEVVEEEISQDEELEVDMDDSN